MQNGETYKNAAEDHNLTGLSFYGSYLLNEKFEVFVRYDKLTSNQVEEAILTGILKMMAD